MPRQEESIKSSTNGVDTSKPRGLDKSNETNGRRVPLIGDRPSRTVRCDHDGEGAVVTQDATRTHEGATGMHSNN